MKKKGSRRHKSTHLGLNSIKRRIHLWLKTSFCAVCSERRVSLHLSPLRSVSSLALSLCSSGVERRSMGIVHRERCCFHKTTRGRPPGVGGWLGGSPSFFRVWLSNVKDTTYLFIHADVTWFGNTPHTHTHSHTYIYSPRAQRTESDFASQGKSPLTRHWMPL